MFNTELVVSFNPNLGKLQAHYFRILNLLQYPDIGQNTDGGLSNFLISGQTP